MKLNHKSTLDLGALDFISMRSPPWPKAETDCSLSGLNDVRPRADLSLAFQGLKALSNKDVYLSTGASLFEDGFCQAGSARAGNDQYKE